MITNKINTILNNSQQGDIDYTICNYIKMNLKEEFLNITSYEEYNKQREKFGTLPRDAEFLSHLDKLYGSGYVGGDISNGVIEELYKPGKRHIGEE